MRSTPGWINSPLLSLGSQKISQSVGGFTEPLNAFDEFGSSTAFIGDLDRDGIEDLAVGVSQDDDGGDSYGSVWMLRLRYDGTVRSNQKISATAGGFTGDLSPQDQFGSSLAALGDLDDDGVPDLAVGAPGNTDKQGGAGEGAVWVLFLQADGTVKGHQKLSQDHFGRRAFLRDLDYFGSSVAVLSRSHGEEEAITLAVGLPGANTLGGIWTVGLHRNGTVSTLGQLTDAYGRSLAAMPRPSWHGGSTTSTGYAALAAGDPESDFGGPDQGAVWVLFLDDRGAFVRRYNISGVEGVMRGALQDGDHFGAAVAALNGTDGDDLGLTGLLVGAPGDSDGGDATGAVYVLTVFDSGTVQSYTKLSATRGGLYAPLDVGSAFGSSLSVASNWTVDNTTIVAVGVPFGRGSSDEQGAVWILRLNSTGQVGRSPAQVGTISSPFVSAAGFQELPEEGSELDGALQGSFRFGFVAALGDLDQDGVEDIAVGAPGEPVGGDGGVGAVYVLFLHTNGTVKAFTRISRGAGGFTPDLERQASFGMSVTCLGDVNGDSIPDLAVGAFNHRDGDAYNPGAIWILRLHRTGAVLGYEVIANSTVWHLANWKDEYTLRVGIASIGDVDEDGVPDLMAVKRHPLFVRYGILIFLLHANGTAKGVYILSESMGTSAANIGDLNGDGSRDIAIGDTQDSDGGRSKGAVWIYFLTENATVLQTQKISRWNGGFAGNLQNGDQLGYSLSALPDLDGDGVQDLAAGAFDGFDISKPTAKGAIWFIFLKTDGTVKTQRELTEAQGGFSGNFKPGTVGPLGMSLASLGDLDGDGYPDLALGMPLKIWSQTQTGMVSVIRINSTAMLQVQPTVLPTLSPSPSPRTPTPTPSTTPSDRPRLGYLHTLGYYKISSQYGDLRAQLSPMGTFGWSSASIGDLDGDGVQDLAVGAPHDNDGGRDVGCVRILFLTVNGTVKSYQKISNSEGGLEGLLQQQDRFGYALASIGDLDGDGLNELAVGAVGNRFDTVGKWLGAMWILFLYPSGEVRRWQKLTNDTIGHSVRWNSRHHLGEFLAAPGDVDNDGVPDLLVGLSSVNTYPDDGAVWLMKLFRNGTAKAIEVLPVSSVQSLATIGDLDQDGNVDFAIKTLVNRTANGLTGGATIFFTSVNGSIASRSEIRREGDGFDQLTFVFGDAFAPLGDINYDGVLDLAATYMSSSDGGPSRGAVALFFLNMNGTLKGYQVISDTQGNFAGTLKDRDYFGSSVALIGDLDGSGLRTIVVGAYSDSEDQLATGAVGAVWILRINASGVVGYGPGPVSPTPSASIPASPSPSASPTPSITSSATPSTSISSSPSVTPSTPPFPILVRPDELLPNPLNQDRSTLCDRPTSFDGETLPLLAVNLRLDLASVNTTRFGCTEAVALADLAMELMGVNASRAVYLTVVAEMEPPQGARVGIDLMMAVNRSIDGVEMYYSIVDLVQSGQLADAAISRLALNEIVPGAGSDATSDRLGEAVVDVLRSQVGRVPPGKRTATSGGGGSGVSAVAIALITAGLVMVLAFTVVAVWCRGGLAGGGGMGARRSTSTMRRSGWTVVESGSSGGSQLSNSSESAQFYATGSDRSRLSTSSGQSNGSGGTISSNAWLRAASQPYEMELAGVLKPGAAQDLRRGADSKSQVRPPSGRASRAARARRMRPAGSREEDLAVRVQRLRHEAVQLEGTVRKGRESAKRGGGRVAEHTRRGKLTAANV